MHIRRNHFYAVRAHGEYGAARVCILKFYILPAEETLQRKEINVNIEDAIPCTNQSVN